MPRLTRLLPRAAVVLTALAVLFGGLPSAGAEATGTIAGTAFEDANRDGVMQAGERPFEGHGVYLYDGAGTYLAYRATDAAGRYAFSGLADGSYRVEYAPPTWWAIRLSLVPTTTATVWPRHDVALAGAATADFGWRAIVTSTDIGAPVSEVVTPAGTRVASYNDAVAAGQVAAALGQGRLIGAEAARTTVRFGFSGSSTCTTGVARVDGRYTDFNAWCYISYESWLDGGDGTLFHEYGHAWGFYHAYIAQQDPQLTSYLAARGLTGDSRLDTSHAWSRHEMLAEDYRQLFGSPNARLYGQENREVPQAAEVTGLEQFLVDTFRSAPPSTGDPAPPPPVEEPPPPPAPTAVHVADLDGVATPPAKTWRAQLTVVLRDDTGAAVAGGQVSVDWVGGRGEGATARCTTGDAGSCSIAVVVKRTTSSVRFSVSDVAASLSYASDQNADADGDSDGTALTLARPA